MRATRDDLVWRTACHEAAHAVAAAALGILGGKITIAREGIVFGSVEFSKDGDNHAWKRWGVRYTRKAIVASYAGPAASIKLEPGLDLFEEGGLFEGDMNSANQLCEWIGDPAYPVYEPAVRNLILETRSWKKAVTLVEQNWSTITAVADKLIEQKTMSGHEVRDLLASGLKRRSRMA